MNDKRAELRGFQVQPAPMAAIHAVQLVLAGKTDEASRILAADAAMARAQAEILFPDMPPTIRRH
jgi:hypothetical protein